MNERMSGVDYLILCQIFVALRHKNTAFILKDMLKLIILNH